jgi:sodium-dependent dicarboxylate transporter 2/3/5
MARISTDRNGPTPPIAVAVAAAIGIVGAAGCWMSGQLSPEGSVTFGTFLMTGLLWVSGAIPPYVAGVAGAAILSAAIPTGLLAADSAPSVPWMEVVRQAVSPAVVMTLAGMMLALAAARTGMDRVIAERLLGPTLHRPAALLASVLASGALLSMFMSNTATAVLLLAIVVPIVAPMGRESPAARAVVLAAALGAAVGGLATPIGTSPNVIAYGLIREAGLQVGFLQWAAVGLPVAVAVLLCGALVLRSLADGFRAWTPPARARRLPRPGLAGWTWCAVFLATVVLWSTQPWTAIPIERASLLPIVALPALGLVRAPELRAIDWRTLLLLFAGLVLGAAMGRTGVAAWMVGWSVPATAPDAVVVASFCAVSVVLSTFMSNTATANLLVPMALALGDPALALPCALASALGSSLAVGLPVSTPPMLLAHATGFVRPRELAMLGVVIGLLGTLAVTASIRLR